MLEDVVWALACAHGHFRYLRLHIIQWRTYRLTSSLT
jgi:hypothetical protein